MTLTSALVSPKPNLNLSLPDHTQLPDSDGSFVKNFQEHPQSIILTSAIEPILQELHPDGHYCIGQDSGIYWQITEPPEKGAEAPDWFYVPNVSPLLNGEYRRSYVLWQEPTIPLIAIEFVSGNGFEERDNSPLTEAIDPKTGKRKRPGKFWVYEQAIKIPFYAIYEVKKAAVYVYTLINGKYEIMGSNDRGHYPIAPIGVELGILYGQEETSIPWLRWWDNHGNLLLTGSEQAIKANERANSANQRAILAEAIALQERQEKIAERQQKQKLEAHLRSLGIDPDQI
jgi:Uma2 family endonuclease